MNSEAKENEPVRSKGPKQMSDKSAKDHSILEQIMEARRNCGDEVKMLPVVRYEQTLWFFDERLRQLRNI